MNYLQIQFPEDFEKRYKKYKDQLLHSSTKNTFSKIPSDEPKTTAQETETKIQKSEGKLKEIYYNPKTGIGNVDTKQFRIKPSDVCFNVFASLYGTINSPVSRQDVLVDSGFYQEGDAPDPARRSNETLHINEKIAKVIRRILKIDVNTLINNDGNLTLIGSKIKSPKLSQTAPK